MAWSEYIDLKCKIMIINQTCISKKTKLVDFFVKLSRYQISMTHILHFFYKKLVNLME